MTDPKQTLEQLGQLIAEAIWNDIQKTLSDEKNNSLHHIGSGSGDNSMGNSGNDFRNGGKMLPVKHTVYITDSNGELKDLMS